MSENQCNIIKDIDKGKVDGILRNSALNFIIPLFFPNRTLFNGQVIHLYL